jgi:hypothetical protein
MAKSQSSEPPAEDAGGSEASAGNPSDSSAEQPWWSADDEEFAGATPLFDGVKRPHPDAEPPPPPPGPDAVGSPIGEALKLAGAFMQWAEHSGLSDTIRELAAEAATALEDVGQAGETPDNQTGQSRPRTIHAVPLHTAAGAEGEQPILVCDYCPLCRGMEVVRTVQPQMSQGVAEAMASLTSALNYAVDGFVRRQRHRDQR